MTVFLDQFDDARRIDRRIRHELQHRRIGMRVNLDDAGRFRRDAQPVRFHQRLGHLRQFTEAIDQLFLQIVDRLRRLAIGEALIQRQAFVHVAAIFVRQQRRHMQIDFRGRGQRRGQIRLLPVLQRSHRLIEHI